MNPLPLPFAIPRPELVPAGEFVRLMGSTALGHTVHARLHQTDFRERRSELRTLLGFYAFPVRSIPESVGMRQAHQSAVSTFDVSLGRICGDT
jgi:hypothetical protein